MPIQITRTMVKSESYRLIDVARLRGELQRHGVSQNALAREMGMDTGQMSRMLSGRANPSGPTLARLRDAMHRLTGEEYL